MNALPARTLRVVWALVAACLCALPLVSLLRQPSVAWGFCALLAFLLVVTAVRPVAGLLLASAMLPLTFGIESLLRSGLPLASVAECMVLAFVSGSALSEGWLAAPASRWRLAWPALLLGALVFASAATGLAVFPVPEGQRLGSLIWQHVTGPFFVNPRPFMGLHHALMWIEFLAIAAFAERALARTPALAEVAVRVWLIGGAGAAAFAALRLAEISLRREDPWAALWRFLRTERITVLQTDPNAAGSFYALYLVAAVLFVLWGRRWWMGAATWPLLGLGLHVAQSRSAIVAASAVLGIVAMRTLLRGHRLIVASVVAVAVAAGAWLTFFSTTDTHATFGQAVEVRAELARVALRIARDHPVFGVGIGEFVAASRDYIGPELIAMFPPAAHGENAHNNLLQILSELGITGFAAFVWLLVAGMGRAGPSGPAYARTAVIAGLVAFVLTALAGHPLLQFPVAVAFFLALGIASGLAPSAPASAPAGARIGLALFVAVLAAVPFRVLAARAEEPAIVGASEVEGEIDGLSYRRADVRSRWSFHAQTRVVTFPLRWMEPGPTDCGVRIEIDNRPGDLVRPLPGVWMPIRLVLPPTDRPNEPRVVELRVDDPRCQLMVGTLTTR